MNYLMYTIVSSGSGGPRGHLTGTRAAMNKLMHTYDGVIWIRGTKGTFNRDEGSYERTHAYDGVIWIRRTKGTFNRDGGSYEQTHAYDDVIWIRGTNNREEGSYELPHQYDDVIWIRRSLVLMKLTVH